MVMDFEEAGINVGKAATEPHLQFPIFMGIIYTLMLNLEKLLMEKIIYQYFSVDLATGFRMLYAGPILEKF